MSINQGDKAKCQKDIQEALKDYDSLQNKDKQNIENVINSTNISFLEKFKSLYETVYIYIIVLLIFLYLLFTNFTSILNMKWYIDFFKLNNAICLQNSVSGLEIESLRYNLSHFIKTKYHNIKSSFVFSKKLIEYFFIIISTLMIIFSYYKPYGIFVTIIVILLGFVYYLMSSYIKNCFSDIDAILLNQDSDINVYQNTFTILNALIKVSEIQNDVFEINNNKFNIENKTLDKIIENNIASYYNLSVSAKVLEIKQKAYEDLDFLKFIILNKESLHYLKYFEDIYFKEVVDNRFKDEHDESFEKRIYIKDIMKNTVDFDVIKNNFKKILKILQSFNDEELPKEFRDISDYIENYLPIIEETDSLEDMIEKYKDFYYHEIFFHEHTVRGEKPRKLNTNYLKNVNSIEIIQMINEIQYNLDNEEFIEKYNTLNENLKKILSGRIKIENNDFIKYLFTNYDILNSDNNYFQDDNNVKGEPLQKTINAFERIGNTLYSYIIYIICVVIFLQHYIFNTKSLSEYIIIMISIMLIIIVSILSHKYI